MRLVVTNKTVPDLCFTAHIFNHHVPWFCGKRDLMFVYLRDFVCVCQLCGSQLNVRICCFRSPVPCKFLTGFRIFKDVTKDDVLIRFYSAWYAVPIFWFSSRQTSAIYFPTFCNSHWSPRCLYDTLRNIMRCRVFTLACSTLIGLDFLFRCIIYFFLKYLPQMT